MGHGLGEAPRGFRTSGAQAMPGTGTRRQTSLSTGLHALATVIAVTACVACFVQGLPLAIPLASVAMLLSTFAIPEPKHKKMPGRANRRFGAPAIVSVTASFGLAPAVIAIWSAWEAVPGWGIVSYPAILIGVAWVCAIAYRMAWNEVIWAAHMQDPHPQRRQRRIATLPMVAVAVPATCLACSMLGVPQMFGGALAVFEAIWSLLVSSNSFYATHPEPFYDESLPPVATGLVLAFAATAILLVTG